MPHCRICVYAARRVTAAAARLISLWLDIFTCTVLTAPITLPARSAAPTLRHAAAVCSAHALPRAALWSYHYPPALPSRHATSLPYHDTRFPQNVAFCARCSLCHSYLYWLPLTRNIPLYAVLALVRRTIGFHRVRATFSTYAFALQFVCACRTRTLPTFTAVHLHVCTFSPCAIRCLFPFITYFVACRRWRFRATLPLSYRQPPPYSQPPFVTYMSPTQRRYVRYLTRAAYARPFRNRHFAACTRRARACPPRAHSPVRYAVRHVSHTLPSFPTFISPLPTLPCTFGSFTL